MTATILVRLAGDGLLLALALAAPIVLATALSGLIVGVLQAATQVQEPTIPLVPRLAAGALALAVTGPWIGEQLVRFSAAVLAAVAQVG